MNTRKPSKVIYFDYAATTPLDPAVLAEMNPFLRSEYGNPSSIYNSGMRAKLGVENARERIAQVLNCRPSEIIFTAGGTESANMALFGILNSYLWDKKLLSKKPHLIVSAIEHHAVLESAKALKNRGAEVTFLRVDSQGFVSPVDLQRAIKPNTVLVSIMYANNEVGTVQPIREIAAVVKKANTQRVEKKLPAVLLHTDACQALGALDVNVSKLNVDLFTANASKIYGPKQVGLLYIRTGVVLQPFVYGGGQEKGLRGGTENVAGAVGFAKAVEVAQKNKLIANNRLEKLRNYFYAQLKKKVKGILLNGPAINIRPDKYSKFRDKNMYLRLPNNLNISIKNVEGEALLLYLNAKGIEVSTGSACSSTSIDPSHVLLALGQSRAQAKSSIRITLGKQTTKAQIDFFLKVFPGLVKQLRAVKFELR